MSSLVTRRAAIGGGMAGILTAKQAPALIFRRSRQRFDGWKHINLNKWAANRPTGSNLFGSFYTSGELAQVKALGVDSVRFAFAPDPFINAKYTNDAASFTALIAQLLGAIDALQSAGLKVNVDMHFNTSSVWSANVVTASSDPAAPAFQAYVAACVDIARNLGAHYLPEQVAFGLFNEPDSPCDAYWGSVLAPYVQTVVRAQAPYLTTIVSGTLLGNIDGLIGQNGSVGLNPTLFDTNTLFDVHVYDPAPLTNCNRFGAGGSYKYTSALPYPPDGISATSSITTGTNRINADSSLTSGQKTAAIASLTSFLNNYFTNLTRPWTLNNFARVAAWCAAQRVEPSAIYVGEFGASHDLTADSTTDATRAAWLGDIWSSITSHGHRGGAWAWDAADSFSVQDFVTPGAVSAPVKAGLGYS